MSYEHDWNQLIDTTTEIRVMIPKGIDWNKLKATGLRPMYGALIIAQVKHRLLEDNNIDSTKWVALSSVALEKIHRKYSQYLKWFIQEGVLQVKSSYRSSGKGKHFCRQFRFTPAFIKNSGGWRQVLISDKRAIKSFRNFIKHWDLANSVEPIKTENINNTHYNNKHNNVMHKHKHKDYYMFSVSGETEVIMSTSDVDTSIEHMPVEVPQPRPGWELEFERLFGIACVVG